MFVQAVPRDLFDGNITIKILPGQIINVDVDKEGGGMQGSVWYLKKSEGYRVLTLPKIRLRWKWLDSIMQYANRTSRKCLNSIIAFTE